MPTTRRQTVEHDANVQSDEMPAHDAPLADGFDNEELEHDEDFESPFPPPGLKEISSLASWTVSTAKPGNGVAALRSPDMAQFWQSDGPQPHLLNIHFFKIVPIVLIRIFLDSVNDESYTPTKIQLLAGMGAHDLQDFAEMEFESPNGWLDVDFSSVGPTESDDMNDKDTDWSKRPVLRAMLLQIKILENHQNGKDTHLRGIQIFARDETYKERQHRTKTTILPHRVGTKQRSLPNNIKLASWMQEPDLR